MWLINYWWPKEEGLMLRLYALFGSKSGSYEPFLIRIKVMD